MRRKRLIEVPARWGTDVQLNPKAFPQLPKLSPPVKRNRTRRGWRK